MRGFAGIHFSLDDFAGDRCEFRVEGTGVNSDRVYALDVKVQGRRTGLAERVWEGDVLFGEAPRLIIHGNYQEGGELDVGVRCDETGRRAVFAVDYSQLGPSPRPISAEGGRGVLKAWRMEGSGSPVGRRGLSDDDVKKLRALGYVR